MDIRHPLNASLGPQFTGDPRVDNHWHNSMRPSAVVSGAKPELGVQEANDGALGELGDALGLAMHVGGQGMHGQRPKLHLN